MTYGVQIRVGCSEWTIPKELTDRFPPGPSNLERYAAVLPALEVNLTFRDYFRPRTCARWAEVTPDDFRFAVKMHTELTHVTRLEEPALLKKFLEPVLELGPKLGPILMQLPLTLGFDEEVGRRFFDALRGRFDGAVVCEAKHAGWFTDEAEAFLIDHRVARVASDPARRPAAHEPGGWPEVIYFRRHGTPKMYYSSYPDEALDEIARRVSAAPATADRWCIFNNTFERAMTANALGVLARLKEMA